MYLRSVLVTVLVAILLQGGETQQDQPYIANFLFPGQSWTGSSGILMFNEVDKANATFSGTYVMVQNGAQSAFPFYGKYDPAGYMIGWVVSFHNKTTNNHQVGVWSGYTIYEGGYPKHYFYMTKLIATQVFVDPKPEKDVFRL